MVFKDESSEDTSSLLYMHSTSSTDGLNQVPFSVEDPDYQGLELETMSPCEKHGKASERLVAFEGTDTGRRFLACAEPERQNCGFVEWVDHQWPTTMQNALLKLWAMVEDSKSARVNDNLESSFTIHHLTEEKNKLKANYDKLVQDVHQLMSFQEDRVVDFRYLQDNLTYQQQCRIIQNLKLKHIKDKQLLSEDKMNLELKNAELTKSEEKLTREKLELKLQIAELMKAEEKLKEKIKGIQAILEK
ncbi:hypothetical protein VPH35_094451 [Triticum aestivum]